MKQVLNPTHPLAVLTLAFSLAACADGAPGAPQQEAFVPLPPLSIGAQSHAAAPTEQSEGQGASAPAPEPASVAQAPTPVASTEPVAPIDAPLTASGCTLPAGPLSFQQAKRPEHQLPAECVPTWTRQQLSAGFAAVRDTRWLEWSELPGFTRRIPWLSANTGCEERAVTARYFLEAAGYPAPWFARARNKDPRHLFTLQTDNEPGGVVRWGGHVAPVVRVEGALLVLDPAIEPTRPLPLRDWLERFSTVERRDVALCRDREEMDGCMDAEPRLVSGPDGFIDAGLGEEWRVQELLGRDPYRVLGKCPPWVSCLEPEPTADPDRAPTLSRFATDQFSDLLGYPLFILGDNFVPGLTTVRIQSESIDELVPIVAINLRRIEVDIDALATALPDGTYLVSAANGELESAPLTLRLPLF